jgi:hypothetical protein
VGLRTALAAPAVAVAAVALLAGPAAAEPAERACFDFATRIEAQAALDSRSADPDRLDPDHDGQACQARLGEPAVSAERATGDGGGAALFAFALGGAGMGVLVARAAPRRTPLRRPVA